MRKCDIPNCNQDITKTKDYGSYVIINSITYNLCKRHAEIYKRINFSYQEQIRQFINGFMQ